MVSRYLGFERCIDILNTQSRSLRVFSNDALLEDGKSFSGQDKFLKRHQNMGK